jgi:uncharacterized membrane protein
MAYCAERDENFTLTVLVTIQQKYFSQIFTATFLILLVSNGLSMAFNYSGYTGRTMSFTCYIFFYNTNYSTYYFQRPKRIRCYKI